ncbi:VOC family protein [Propionicicella superfundia]|uniref:VOC family protein n=1 Tax=Propionicicella superfundia TaxID=348582 RepID=UPI0003FA83D6|nr:VOC family protein [Propionicicella superfundia]
MNDQQLPADTAMGTVSLDVGDLDAMTAFYHDVILLDVLSSAGDVAELGRAGRTLVRLRHRPGLPRGERRSAGLFHTALLHPDPTSLATTLASVAVHAPSLYTGAGEHLVSQAFYLDDPEGNGIELYWDRPRSEWSWDDAGHVRMDTLYIDPNGFLAEHLAADAKDFVLTDPDRRHERPLAPDEVVGHVHLKVGQAARAKDFYVGLLGFELTAEMPGAVFVSAGGYHHHMAMNTWASQGVGLRSPGLGLGRVDIELPGRDAVLAAAARLRAGGVAVADSGEAVEADDPWGNRVRLTGA